MTNWKERIKNAFNHKHDWKEDQWGKRCQTCGAINLNKFRKRREKLASGLSWFLDNLQLALAISALILISKYGIDEGKLREVIVYAENALGPSYWVMVYLLMMFAIQFLRFTLTNRREHGADPK